MAWQRDGAKPPAYRFTDKEEDRLSGAVHIGARHYLPALGRWASVDSLYLVESTSRIERPRETNPYAYLMGNPLAGVDPTGLKGWLDRLSDAAAGFGDAVMFGLTEKVREGLGVNDVVDKDSEDYRAGVAVGVATEVAGAAATGAGAIKGLAKLAKNPGAVGRAVKGGLARVKDALARARSEAGVAKKAAPKGGGPARTAIGPARAEPNGHRFKNLAEGFQIGTQKFTIKQHAINSLRKSGRRSIQPESMLRALESTPTPGTPGSRVFTDPSSGARFFVNDSNAVVGVHPPGFIP